MRLLVLAQTPPPVHGQSLMVQTAVSGLASEGIEVTHVPFNLSGSGAEIGRWRFSKVAATLKASLRARSLLGSGRFDALYYVPAPAKRGALYRDIVAMALCRSRRVPLVLHWHACGLGAWIDRRATALERALCRWALGKADLSIVLAPELAEDASRLAPRRIAIVANGANDPGEGPGHREGHAVELLYVGLGSQEKGLFDLMEAVAVLQTRLPGRFRLTFAGGFASADDEAVFARLAAGMGSAVRHAGFADEERKKELYRSSDIFCMLSRYPHEGQPLALVEAMAHDLRVVATRWRAIPGMLPAEHTWFVEPGNTASIADSLRAAAAAPRPCGAMRRHYLAHFTRQAHLASLGTALRSLQLRER